MRGRWEPPRFLKPDNRERGGCFPHQRHTSRYVKGKEHEEGGKKEKSEKGDGERAGRGLD